MSYNDNGKDLSFLSRFYGFIYRSPHTLHFKDLGLFNLLISNYDSKNIIFLIILYQYNAARIIYPNR